MKKLLALLLIATQTAWAGLPPTTIKGQNDASPKTKFAFQVPNNQATDLGGIKALIETGSDDVLANPTFQATGVSSSVVPSWTLAGAGVTAGVSTNPTFGNDPQVLSLTLSGATGDLLSQDVTPKSTASFAGINLENSLWVYAPTSGVTLQVCARLSGADVSGACVSVPNIGGWAYVPASSVGGAGSAGVSLFASASSTGTVYVTHGYVGRNRGLSNATPITYPTAYTPTFTGFGTVSNVAINYWQEGAYGVIDGTVTLGTVAASLASISLPSGWTLNTGILSISGNTTASAGSKVGQYTDNATNGVGAIVTAPGTNTSLLYFAGEYANASNVQLIPSNGSSISVSSSILHITAKVPISQLAASVPIASLANVSANYSGTMAGVGGGWANSGGAGYTDFSVATTSSTLTQLSGVNITCSAEATKLPSITCTVPKSNSRYKVCATVTVANTGSGNGSAVRMVDGSAIMNGGAEITAAAANAIGAITLCGNETPSSTTITPKLQGVVSAGTASINQSALTPITWTVEQVDSSGPQPYATGNVSSKTTGQKYTEAFAFSGNAAMTANCTADPCTVLADPGVSITVNRTGTGAYVAHFSEFSAEPICTCNIDDNLSAFSCLPVYGSGSNTTMTFHTKNSAGTLSDAGAIVTCIGPH